MNMTISIHAPRTGSDMSRGGTKKQSPNFNPRSPHGERQHADLIVCDDVVFQSTLPARGATESIAQAKKVFAFQSTLPARGATLQAGSSLPTWQYFNPRSPHGERRPWALRMGTSARYFNPRSPHGERRCKR